VVLKFASLLFCYLAVLLNTYVFVKVYGVIGHKEFKLTCSNLIVLMIFVTCVAVLAIVLLKN